MSEARIAIGDADALIALSHPSDTNHEKSLAFLSVMAENKTTIVFPASSFIEAVTAARRKLHSPSVTRKILDLFQHDKIIIIPIGEALIIRALPYFDPTGPKRNTFFDAVICAVAESHHTKTIFSFDKWYQKQGFKITSDIL